MLPATGKGNALDGAAILTLGPKKKEEEVEWMNNGIATNYFSAGGSR